MRLALDKKKASALLIKEMTDPVDKISLWTEGLDEGWSMDSSQVGHIDRGSKTIEEIVKHVEMLVFRYGDELDCRLIVRFKEKILHVQLSNKLIEASDPNDQTYQNIPVLQDKLAQFLEEFIYEEPEEEESGIKFREDRKGIMAMLGAVVVLVLAVYFSGFYGNEDQQFMPTPEAEKLKDPLEIQNFYDAHAGIYATGIDDGEMIIELKENGAWAYYDLVKQTCRQFAGEAVSSGIYVPGKEETTTAIVTDKSFVFYPKAEGKLEFLQRPFSKVADSREELAYLELPGLD